MQPKDSTAIDPGPPGSDREPGRQPTGSDAHPAAGSVIDAARGQKAPMSPNQGDANALHRSAAAASGNASLGSRTGSSLGSQTERTGLADGQPQGSSQGIAGAEGSGGGADLPPSQPPRSAPDA